MTGPTPPQRYERAASTFTRAKGCRNKVRYHGRKQALSALNPYRSAHPDDPDLHRMEAYRCRAGCRGWHIGHSSW